MPFKRILTELVEAIPGATGAILADWEGESVEHYSFHDDYELKFIAAHQGIILDRMKACHSEVNGAREVRDGIISTDRGHILTGTVGPEYCLVVILERQAIVGYALRCFRRTVGLLEKEIY